LQMTQLDLTASPSVAGVPLLILVYPIYIVLCISLSLDALRRPGPTARVMGDLARHRARPWLMAASIALLLVSLLVGWVMLQVVLTSRRQTFYEIYKSMALAVGWFDLVIASLIGVAVLLLGQAIVSYEVFTGKTLPRRGLMRHWRRAVILAVGYGLVVGWSLTFRLRAVYGLLLTTMLMTLFYALLNWRSYAERERYIEHLRPFVASQRLYEHLLTASASPALDVDAKALFHALCDDVLGVRAAYLVPLGPLTPLVGPALAYPEGAAVPSLLAEARAQFDSPQTMCVPLDPTRHGGAVWAVSLWSERGLIGALLLGDKHDGGLYTQEEIEIARASGERLMDTLASAEIARRLMALQRQRLTESQVIDRRARRVLHDDVLPLLHAAMLTLRGTQAEPGEGTADAVALMADAHRQISDLLREMPTTAAPEVGRLGLIRALRRAVEEELSSAFDGVEWQIEPEVEQDLSAIPPLTAEVLFYAAREAIRNAAQHGRDGDTGRPLHLRVGAAWRDGLEICIEDDGVGLGAVDSPAANSGQGLALHSTMMAVVGGTLAVESLPGAYTRVSLRLPQETGQGT
jgi:signal transduction histidine kinase